MKNAALQQFQPFALKYFACRKTEFSLTKIIFKNITLLSTVSHVTREARSNTTSILRQIITYYFFFVTLSLLKVRPPLNYLPFQL